MSAKNQLNKTKWKKSQRSSLTSKSRFWNGLYNSFQIVSFIVSAEDWCMATQWKKLHVQLSSSLNLCDDQTACPKMRTRSSGLMKQQWPPRDVCCAISKQWELFPSTNAVRASQSKVENPPRCKKTLPAEPTRRNNGNSRKTHALERMFREAGERALLAS